MAGFGATGEFAASEYSPDTITVAVIAGTDGLAPKLADTFIDITLVAPQAHTASDTIKIRLDAASLIGLSRADALASVLTEGGEHIAAFASTQDILAALTNELRRLFTTGTPRDRVVTIDRESRVIAVPPDTDDHIS